MKTYVIYGSPLSGKSTYVQKHRGPNDIIFDFDLIMNAISGLGMHERNNNLINYVLDIRGLIISKLKAEKSISNAWIIVTRVTEELKQSLVGLNAEYIEMKSDIITAKKRLHDNPDGRDVQGWNKAIEKYFATTKDYSSFYNSLDWKRKRIIILKRDGYRCQEAKRYGKAIEANTVHHIIPIAERPDLKLNSRNLISLTSENHERMHNKFNNELSKLGLEWKERLLRKYPQLRSPPV